MKSLSMEQIILIALLEKMLRKGLMDKGDLLDMRQFSLNLLAQFSETTETASVDSAYKMVKEIGDFFEAYLRTSRQ